MADHHPRHFLCREGGAPSTDCTGDELIAVGLWHERPYGVEELRRLAERKFIVARPTDRRRTP